MAYISETKPARIAATLEEMILDNSFKGGTYLPSQQSLAEQFNASSRSIREALKLLEAKGLILIAQGHPAQIRTNNLDQYVESLSTKLMNSRISSRKLMKNLMQVRTIVATSAAREFSRLVDRESYLAQLWKASNSMEGVMSLIYEDDDQGVKAFHDAENEFHHILIKANGNQILSSIYDNLAPMLETALGTIKFTPLQLEKRSKDYSYLCEALQDGQTDLAVALILVTLTTIDMDILSDRDTSNLSGIIS